MLSSSTLWIISDLQERNIGRQHKYSEIHQIRSRNVIADLQKISPINILCDHLGGKQIFSLLINIIPQMHRIELDLLNLEEYVTISVKTQLKSFFLQFAVFYNKKNHPLYGKEHSVKM